MQYINFCNEKISRLGFGAMRLPCLEGGAIDENHVQQMVDYALENGVNYFDTAYPYHGGMSEIVLGKCLSKHQRDSYFIATKYPGHQLAESYNPAEIFEEQLKKCKVDYFDFYLLHNVYENCIDVYTDDKIGIVNYFVEQKKLGRIKHLGISTHADLDTLKKFLNKYENVFEFCQIQMNYIDWTLQNGKAKYEFFQNKQIPLIIMEPLRGGKLCKLSDKDFSKLKAIRPNDTQAAWALNYLLTLDNAKIILSGMSNLDQMKQNIATVNKNELLSSSETEELYKIAEEMKNEIPCTECRYCTSACPMKLDIPNLIRLYNDTVFDPSFTVSMKVEALPEKKQPSSCMHCGRCELMCPQKIHISEVMADFSEKLSKLPKWSQICKEREEANKKAKLLS